MHLLPVVLVLFLISCGSEQTVAPSFVARTWSLEIGAPQEASSMKGPGTAIRFGDAGRVEVRGAHGDKGENQACCEEWPLVIEGQTSFWLPPAPWTVDELREEGLRVAGVTYCAFLNGSGVPREEDVGALDRAVMSLLSRLEIPLQEATPTEEELRRVTQAAREGLLKDVLRELEIPESEDAMLDAQGNQGLWFIGDLRRISYYSSSDLVELIDLLPSLVWVYGDPDTRQTLSACGSMLYVDAPYDLLRNQLPQLGPRCGNQQGYHSKICALELIDIYMLEVELSHPDARRIPYARWRIEPTVGLGPLR